jgi:hypothetical protein
MPLSEETMNLQEAAHKYLSENATKDGQQGPWRAATMLIISFALENQSCSLDEGVHPGQG